MTQEESTPTADNAAQPKKEWHPFDMFNETSAKRLAFGLVFILTCLHAARNYFLPYDSCAALFDGGTYLGPEAWQPSGCTMHRYSTRDAPKCLRDQRVVIVGDSRMRQLYFSLLRTVTAQPPQEGKIHSNIIHREIDINLDIEFWWQPEVNDSTVEAYKRKILHADVHVDKHPLFVVHGAAAWTIKLRDASPNALDEYKQNLTKIASLMEDATKMTDVIWMLQPPVQTELLSDTRKMITNEQIDLYNSAAGDILGVTKVKLWHTAKSTASHSHQDSSDGLHLTDETLDVDVQLLLNRFCNHIVEPSDATCCAKPLPPMNAIQKLTFGFFIVNFVFAVFFKFQSERRRRIMGSSAANHVDAEAANHIVAAQSGVKEKPHWVDTAYVCTNHLARYGLVMLYVYMCDRTELFPKRQKHFSGFYFFFFLFVAMAISMFLHADTKKPSILNLDQTKEWKGWMQIVILIYHYLGASKVIPIYMHLRLIVASYLFMTAYGQFCASWDKNKFGLARVCNVLFRMNLLVIFLCLVMDRQYQLYYFVPLVSFWFLVIYTTMALFPCVTRKSAEENSSHYLLMLGKFLGLVVVILLFSTSEVVFNLAFEWWPLNQLFVYPGTSLYEWWFRWNLDKFIIPYGMFFGFVLLAARSFKWVDDNHSGNLFSLPVSIIVQALAALVFIISTYHSYLCTSKPDCNRIHTFTSFLPITAFIVLRNTSGFIRRKFSVFAAWFGDISLELFIAQYHIWLAQDTKTLLVLVPGFPAVNVIVTTFIFICVAIELRDITGMLTKLAVSDEPRKLYTRLVCFASLLGVLLLYTTYLR